jgi:hypothetical protein
MPIGFVAPASVRPLPTAKISQTPAVSEIFSFLSPPIPPLKIHRLPRGETSTVNALPEIVWENGPMVIATCPAATSSVAGSVGSKWPFSRSRSLPTCCFWIVSFPRSVASTSVSAAAGREARKRSPVTVRSRTRRAAEGGMLPLLVGAVADDDFGTGELEEVRWRVRGVWGFLTGATWPAACGS